MQLLLPLHWPGRHKQAVFIGVYRNQSRERQRGICRSLIPKISAACHQLILLAIACNLTSCIFIARCMSVRALHGPPPPREKRTYRVRRSRRLLLTARARSLYCASLSRGSRIHIMFLFLGGLVCTAAPSWVQLLNGHPGQVEVPTAHQGSLGLGIRPASIQARKVKAMLHMLRHGQRVSGIVSQTCRFFGDPERSSTSGRSAMKRMA